MANPQFSYTYKPLAYADAQKQVQAQLDPLYNRAVQNVNTQKYQNDVQSGQVAAARGLAHSGLAADMLNKNAIAAQGSVADLNAQKATQTAQLAQDLLNQDKTYNLQNRSQMYNEWMGQQNLAQQDREWQNTLAQQKLAEQWKNLEWNQMSPAEKAKMALQYQYAKKSGSGGGGGSTTKTASAQDIINQILSQLESDTYQKMRDASPKADPNATSGITSQPGSYWYARGYGSKYLPK